MTDRQGLNAQFDNFLCNYISRVIVQSPDKSLKAFECIFPPGLSFCRKITVQLLLQCTYRIELNLDVILKSELKILNLFEFLTV